MKKDIETLQQTVKLLTKAVTELLVWTQQAENHGAVPIGTLSRAKDFLELERVRDDIMLIEEALEALGSGTKGQLQARLRARVSLLQEKLDSLQKRIHGTT